MRHWPRTSAAGGVASRRRQAATQRIDPGRNRAMAGVFERHVQRAVTRRDEPHRQHEIGEPDRHRDPEPRLAPPGAAEHGTGEQHGDGEQRVQPRGAPDHVERAAQRREIGGGADAAGGEARGNRAAHQQHRRRDVQPENERVQHDGFSPGQWPRGSVTLATV